jgi:hypothetical protein
MSLNLLSEMYGNGEDEEEVDDGGNRPSKNADKSVADNSEPPTPSPSTPQQGKANGKVEHDDVLADFFNEIESLERSMDDISSSSPLSSQPTQAGVGNKRRRSAWEVCFDKKAKQFYYWDTNSGKVTWERPSEDDGDVPSLEPYHHLQVKFQQIVQYYPPIHSFIHSFIRTKAFTQLCLN